MPQSHLVDPSLLTEDQAQFTTADSGSTSTKEEDVLGDAAVQQTPKPQQPSQEDALLGDEVPEKYRNKTARELLDIALNQESQIGKQSTELGELRKQKTTLEGLVDQALTLREHGTTVGHQRVQEEEVELTDDDFTLNPREAVTRTIQQHTRKHEQQLAALQAKERAFTFSQMHPTAAQDVNDEKFVAWVTKNPARQRMAQKALGDPQNIDFETADTLWTLWEEAREGIQDTAPAAEDAGEQSAQPTQATPTKPKEEPPDLMDSTSATTSAPGKKSGKLYSETKLQEMQYKDPDKYWSKATQDAIEKAYQEGRVVRDLGV